MFLVFGPPSRFTALMSINGPVAGTAALEVRVDLVDVPEVAAFVPRPGVTVRLPLSGMAMVGSGSLLLSAPGHSTPP